MRRRRPAGGRLRPAGGRLALLLVLLAAAALFYWRARRVSRLRALALRELERLESMPA